MAEILIIIIPFMILSALGLPIAFGLCAGALCGILLGGFPTALIGQRMIVLADSYIIMAIPFFIMAGEIMTAGGATQKIVDVSKLLVGRIRGGLAQANVVGSIIFAGLSGSSAADTAAIGGIVVPAMLKEGYSKGFTVAVTCASGALGPILPPSLFMVIYGRETFSHEWKKDWSEKQFLRHARRYPIGPFKRDWWALEECHDPIREAICQKALAYFATLGVEDTQDIVVELRGPRTHCMAAHHHATRHQL